MKAFQAFTIWPVVQPAVREHPVHIGNDQADALQLFQRRQAAASPDGRTHPFQILRRVYPGAHWRHFEDADRDARLEKPELFQLFQPFQWGRRQLAERLQRLCPVGIDADVP